MDFEDMTEEQLSAVKFYIKSLRGTVNMTLNWAEKYGRKDAPEIKVYKEFVSMLDSDSERCDEALEGFV